MDMKEQAVSVEPVGEIERRILQLEVLYNNARDIRARLEVVLDRLHGYDNAPPSNSEQNIPSGLLPRIDHVSASIEGELIQINELTAALTKL